MARYDKIHLFGLDLGTEHYHEENTIVHGDSVKVVDTPFGKIEPFYLLRFTFSLNSNRAMGQVDMIVVPSAFTETTGKSALGNLNPRTGRLRIYVTSSPQPKGGYHLSGRENPRQQHDCGPLGA